MHKLFNVFMSNDVDSKIIQTLHSGVITQGPRVEEFENMLKTYFNHPYILAVSSGTAGLMIATRLLSLEETDEILTTPLTCTATNFAILANHKNLKWVDVDVNTCNMDLNDLKRKISKNTKAVMVVHWGGNPIDLRQLDEIKRYAKETYNNNLVIIEDCAHAMGAELDGRKIGTHGNICVFSLQAIKHITTGDGGLIFLPNEELYNRAKKLRWFGIDREKRSQPGRDFRLEEDISEWGYKFNMNDLNATIGIHNFPHLDELLVKCRRNADFYEKELCNLPGITLLKNTENSESARWIFSLKVADKGQFVSFMNSKNIVVSQVHNRNDIHSCLSAYKSELPALDFLEKELISIPVGWWITEKDAEYIADCIKEWASRYSFRLISSSETDRVCYTNLIKELNGFSSHVDMYEELVTTNTVYFMSLNGVVIGTGKIFDELKLYDRISHIEDIVITKEFRRKGYGAVLVKYLLNQSKGYKTVLNCLNGLEKFYRYCGLSNEGVQMVRRN